MELTFAVAKYVCDKSRPNLTEPPYASSLDCVAPLFAGKDFSVNHRARDFSRNEPGLYCVTIYPRDTESAISIQAFASTEPRARCLALLKEQSGKVRVAD